MEKAIAEKKAWLEGILARYEALNAACDAVMKVGAMDPDGALWRAIWAAWEHLLEQCDPDNWISWYIHDNDCGRNKFKVNAGRGGEDQVIDSVEALARFLWSPPGEGGLL
jgi:hypothetical protein